MKDTKIDKVFKPEEIALFDSVLKEKHFTGKTPLRYLDLNTLLKMFDALEDIIFAGIDRQKAVEDAISIMSNEQDIDAFRKMTQSNYMKLNCMLTFISFRVSDIL
jgi:hypothetical protein